MKAASRSRRSFVLGCALAAPLGAALASAPVLDAPNVVAISPRLVTSGQPTAAALSHLAELGFGAGPPGFDTLPQRSRADSALLAATAYCQGTLLRNEIEAQGGSRLAEATEIVAAAIAARFGSGPVEGAIQAQVVTVQRES